jgi:light-regulated signal transduction histidine kinase (bacteriophytochrome)
MKALINDLLMYSRVQRGTDEVKMVDCQQVLDQVLDDLQLTIEDTAATITHDPLPKLIGNERQLVQLFQNLIANALKFRQEAPPQVHIGCEDRRGEWLFCVRDNGIGIETQYLERIFVIFQRLHSRREYSGTGIGLAICKKVVENHGGQIWAESEVGSGTTFYFTLSKRKEKGFQNYGVN